MHYKKTKLKFGVVTLFFFLTAIHVNAEKSKTQDSIVIDLLKDGPTQNVITRFSQNTVVLVKVLNLNRLKYDVQIKNTPYYYESKLPENIKLPFFPDLSSAKSAIETKSKKDDQWEDIVQNYSRLKQISEVYGQIKLRMQKKAIEKTSEIKEIKSIIKSGYGLTNDVISLNSLQNSIRSSNYQLINIFSKIIDIPSPDSISDIILKKQILELISIKKFVAESNLDTLLLMAKNDYSAYSEVENLSTTVFTTIQANDNADEIKLSVNLIDKDNDKNKETLLDYSIQVHRYIRPLFSLGLASTGLYDKSYVLNDTLFLKHQIVDGKDSASLVEGKIAKVDESSKISTGVSAFYSVLFYPCAGFGLGLSLGGLFNIPDLTNSSYLAGLTFAYGKRYSGCVSGGVAFGKIKKISNDKYLNQPFISADSEVPLKDKWSYNWFAAITLSVGKKTAVTEE